MLFIKGYEQRQNDQWKISRALQYTVYCCVTDECKRVSIYEYMPLPGDPTKEEIAELNKLRKKQKAKSIADRVANAAKKYLKGKS